MDEDVKQRTDAAFQKDVEDACKWYFPRILHDLAHNAPSDEMRSAAAALIENPEAIENIFETEVGKAWISRIMQKKHEITIYPLE